MQRRPIKVKRVYDQPGPDDGLRVLVDRLWPRGLSRRAASADLWLKDAAPSNALRRWFGHDPRRWSAFCRKYRAELAQRPDIVELLQDLRRRSPLTLLFAAQDEARNNAVALREMLDRGLRKSNESQGRDGMKPPEAWTDAELVSSILAGDARAMAALMRLHGRMLYRTARAILRDDAEAEDAVQEACLQAYRALEGFRGESKLSTWLVRIVANEALMRRRRSLQAAAAMPCGELDPADCESLSGPGGPEYEAQRLQLQCLLESLIEALPEPYRSVFLLRAAEELSPGETAAALGVPQATVRTRYFRARSLLREAFLALAPAGATRP